MNTKLQQIRWVSGERARDDRYDKVSVESFSKDRIKSIRDFHKGFAEYEITPLYRLNKLARHIGVRDVLVKDESERFGLNAFKVLGGSYAIGKYMAERCDVGTEDVCFERLKHLSSNQGVGDMVFVTATDGNHGRGIAWAAKRLEQQSVIFLPRGTAEARVRSIENEGAKAYVLDSNYDEAVRYAKDYADKNDGVFIQDTAWEGYTEIPGWIMKGYTTIAHELEEQLDGFGIQRPTHVFLQAGVGSFAASIQACLTNWYKDKRPVTSVVEPDKANCIFKSAYIKDGNIHPVTGELDTIMAGLACGEPNTVAWGILRDYADMFFSCPDYVAARGTRILANPFPGDPRIISGESGSVGIGLLSLLMERKEYARAVKRLGLNGDSVVVLISTEGDTDPVGYRKILWDGLCPVP